MSESLIVRGGKPLSGTVIPSGNKNSVLPTLAATLLANEPVIIRNVPEITDVEKFVDFFIAHGSRCEWDRIEKVITVDHATMTDSVKESLPEGMRSSVMLFGPLLTRAQSVSMANDATGCSLGAREIDPHLEILEGFGAKIDWSEKRTITLPGRFQGFDHWLDYASVTTTEHFVMCAAVADGTSRLVNAASEPHVQDLCRVLVAMGATIRGIGTSVLEVDGQPELGGCDVRVSDDHHEILTFLAIGAITGGEVRIPHSVHEHFPLMDRVFDKFGVTIEAEHGASIVRPTERLVVRTPRTTNLLTKIEGAPWPYFPVDLIPPIVAMAAVAEGSVLFWNKVYEGAFGWIPELQKFGAQVTVCDPHRVIVVGRPDLRPAIVEAPYIIRVIISLFMVAATIEGESVIRNASPVRRAHPQFVENLRALGADVNWLGE